MIASKLHTEIAKVAPIASARCGKSDDRTTWDWDPAPEATPAEITAGNDVIATIIDDGSVA